MSLIILGNLLVCVAGLLWAIEMFPQILKTYKTKDVKGISPSFFIMCYFAYLLYIFGNGLLENWVVVWSHIPSYITTTTMVCLILKYKKKPLTKKWKPRKIKVKISESKYTYRKDGSVKVKRERKK